MHSKKRRWLRVHQVAYAVEVIRADLQEAGDEDVFRKISADLGTLATEAVIRAKMKELLVEAKTQIMNEHS